MFDEALVFSLVLFALSTPLPSGCAGVPPTQRAEKNERYGRIVAFLAMSRVRRSFSLKAKISEKKAFFLFALKRKKCFFFRFVRMQAKHFKKRK